MIILEWIERALSYMTQSRSKVRQVHLIDISIFDVALWSTTDTISRPISYLSRICSSPRESVQSAPNIGLSWSIVQRYRTIIVLLVLQLLRLFAHSSRPRYLFRPCPCKGDLCKKLTPRRTILPHSLTALIAGAPTNVCGLLLVRYKQQRSIMIKIILVSSLVGKPWILQMTAVVWWS